MSELIKCKNCEESCDDSFKYCPHCGQELADKLTVGILFSNTISNYFSVDARFLKSLLPLMLKPGVLARRFVDGKRQLYLHPAQYYLFVSIIFFFIFSFTIRKADSNLSQNIEKDFHKDKSESSLVSSLDSLSSAVSPDHTESIDSLVDDMANIKKIDDLDSLKVSKDFTMSVHGFRRDILDSLIATGAPQAEKLRVMGLPEDAGKFRRKVYLQALKIYERRGSGIIKTFFDVIPIAMFFMLPLFAFLLMLFHRKKGTFAHHIVFSFYYFTFLFITFSVLALGNELFNIPRGLNALVVLSCIVYLTIAIRNFYGSRWSAALLKANLVSLIYLIIVVPVAIIGMVIVSFLIY